MTSHHPILPLKMSRFKDTNREKKKLSHMTPGKEWSLEIQWFSLVIQELQKIHKWGNCMFLCKHYQL